LPDLIDFAAPEKSSCVDVRADLKRFAGNNGSGARRKLFQFQKRFFGRRRCAASSTLKAGKDCSLG
jgi:hypothetical protein